MMQQTDSTRFERQQIVYKRPLRFIPLHDTHSQETWQEYYHKLFQRIHAKHQCPPAFATHTLFYH